jgi:hypothetical protein
VLKWRGWDDHRLGVVFGVHAIDIERWAATIVTEMRDHRALDELVWAISEDLRERFDAL